MAAEFADESRCRAAVLGGREACDVMKLYPLDWVAMYGSIKRMPDDLLPGGGGSQNRVMVTPDLPTFKLLFRCFCGAVADLQLPENCFFAGSAVLAGATIPQRLYDRRLQEAFDSLVAAEQRCQAIDDWMMGSLKRRQQLPLPALRNIKKCLPPRPTIDALRAEIFAAHAEQAEHTDSELDVLLRTNNGSGPYARSDIDIFVVASNDAEANATVAKLYKLVGEALEEPCTVVKTANTITFCRSWPERHVQIILYYLPSVSAHLIFADLDCTALAYHQGEVFALPRALRALAYKRNVVPASMLANRRDAPKSRSPSTRYGLIC